MNPRVASAHAIAGVLRGEGSLNTLIPRLADKVPPQDRGLFQELCYGTLRWYPQLAVILASLIDKPLKPKDAEVTALLAAALYQLREMGTPGHAAVNEAVAATRILKRPWAKGLVNGVLRRYQREYETLAPQWQQHSAYTSAHPDWLYERLLTAWPEQIDRLIAANNSRAPMTLRVNLLRCSRDNYLDLLATAGMTARPTPHSTSGIQLATATGVDKLPHFDDGWVSVQDEASQLCAPLLSPAPGNRVLDACCAPGGKTSHLLEFQPALDELVALDLDPDRLVRVQQNLDRLQLSATLKACDAADLDQWWDGTPFDRILLDAPCSATGVIRRHPDIKLLRTPDDIAKLAAIQNTLLTTLWSVVRPGGRLLYSTCSVLPEENDQVIAGFLHRHDDAQARLIDADWGLATTSGRQLLPEPDGHDGFYFCLLEKTGTTAEGSP